VLRLERRHNPKLHPPAEIDQKEERVNMVVKRRQKAEVSRIFRKLSKENAFYFFTSVGNYTGESASSSEAFLERIEETDLKSLQFHLYRGDFEKWIAEALEDKELAEEIRNLQSLKPAGDTLRNQLVLIVSKRYEKLLREVVR
jgi:hypothetical protein